MFWRQGTGQEARYKMFFRHVFFLRQGGILARYGMACLHALERSVSSGHANNDTLYLHVLYVLSEHGGKRFFHIIGQKHRDALGYLTSPNTEKSAALPALGGRSRAGAP